MVLCFLEPSLCRKLKENHKVDVKIVLRNVLVRENTCCEGPRGRWNAQKGQPSCADGAVSANNPPTIWDDPPCWCRGGRLKEGGSLFVYIFTEVF